MLLVIVRLGLMWVRGGGGVMDTKEVKGREVSAIYYCSWQQGRAGGEGVGGGGGGGGLGHMI